MRRIRRTIKGIAKIIHEIVTRTISWFGSVSLTEAIANELDYVKVFGGCEFASDNTVPTPTAPLPIVCNNWEIKWWKKWLPTGYVPVEYIHFSGSQYFNSGLIANQDYILEFRRRRTGTWGQYIYGSSTTANTRSLTAYVPSGWVWYWRFGDTYMPYTWESDIWYTTKQDKIWVEIDWIMNEYIDVPSEFETAYSLVIWTNRSGSTVTSSRLIWDIAYGKIYDWDTLVANYIACKRVSDWEYWFYDTVSQTFKTASGLTWWDIVWNIYIEWDTETIEDSLWNTATAEMLLWVTNWTTTIQDTQELLSGAVTRNIWFKIFTSADVIEYQSQSSNKRFVVSAGALSSLWLRNTPMFCTHFQTIDDGRSLDNVPNMSIYGATTNNLYIKYTSYTSKSAFGAWLDAQYEAWTPVIAVYPIQTPTTESVEWQTLNVRSWDNTLTITQAWIDTSKLELEVQYKALEVHY